MFIDDEMTCPHNDILFNSALRAQEIANNVLCSVERLYELQVEQVQKMRDEMLALLPEEVLKMKMSEVCKLPVMSGGVSKGEAACLRDQSELTQSRVIQGDLESGNRQWVWSHAPTQPVIMGAATQNSLSSRQHTPSKNQVSSHGKLPGTPSRKFTSKVKIISKKDKHQPAQPSISSSKRAPGTPSYPLPLRWK